MNKPKYKVKPNLDIESNLFDTRIKIIHKNTSCCYLTKALIMQRNESETDSKNRQKDNGTIKQSQGDEC